MNFQLVPICSEVEHEMKYNYKESHRCDICNKTGISYMCINCEYSRCSKCHRDILASEEISERLKKAKLKNSIKLAEVRLKDDGLDGWDVMVINGEICYINKLCRTYSYDYPKSTTPKLSPELSPTSTPELSTTPEYYDSKDTYEYNIRCTFTEIYNSIRSFF